MDPKITALQNASTSAELKAAIDAFPQALVYYTSEIRDLILLKKNLIVDAPSADAVVSFLKSFSRVYATRNLLLTAEIRGLIIDVLAPKISADDPVEILGVTVCNIVYA